MYQEEIRKIRRNVELAYHRLRSLEAKLSPIVDADAKLLADTRANLAFAVELLRLLQAGENGDFVEWDAVMERLRAFEELCVRGARV